VWQPGLGIIKTVARRNDPGHNKFPDDLAQQVIKLSLLIVRREFEEPIKLVIQRRKLCPPTTIFAKATEKDCLVAL